mmetsp:Transcript_77719/g.251492  ORF Transcript_77719/g.251492 Transcript_77719/m.251492 type:complete len:255 (-) Transcript_77719:371-1135(-)
MAAWESCGTVGKPNRIDGHTLCPDGFSPRRLDLVASERSARQAPVFRVVSAVLPGIVPNVAGFVTSAITPGTPKPVMSDRRSPRVPPKVRSIDDRAIYETPLSGHVVSAAKIGTWTKRLLLAQSVPSMPRLRPPSGGFVTARLRVSTRSPVAHCPGGKPACSRCFDSVCGFALLTPAAYRYPVAPISFQSHAHAAPARSILHCSRVAHSSLHVISTPGSSSRSLGHVVHACNMMSSSLRHLGANLKLMSRTSTR